MSRRCVLARRSLVRKLVGLTFITAAVIVLEPLAGMVLPVLILAVVIAVLVRTLKSS
ncbi:hypothetical protein AB0L41_36320 [Amycolatopsis mediterranei]|uniref:hypothetical protein n=1 Tax=Amycolatopsis mediterranei TaxID=33910 RepID=UPI0034442AC1